MAVNDNSYSILTLSLFLSAGFTFQHTGGSHSIDATGYSINTSVNKSKFLYWWIEEDIDLAALDRRHVVTLRAKVGSQTSGLTSPQRGGFVIRIDDDSNGLMVGAMIHDNRLVQIDGGNTSSFTTYSFSGKTCGGIINGASCTTSGECLSGGCSARTFEDGQFHVIELAAQEGTATFSIDGVVERTWSYNTVSGIGGSNNDWIIIGDATSGGKLNVTYADGDGLPAWSYRIEDLK
jgi:hypothetical protein